MIKNKILISFHEIQDETKGILAYFPYETDADNNGNKDSYMHIWQHGACTKDFIETMCKPCFSMAKIGSLLSELKQLYNDYETEIRVLDDKPRPNELIFSGNY